MDIDEALELAIVGESALFTGAGFSTGAKNLRDEPFKRSRELADYLAGLSGLPSGLDLEEASEEFASQHGEDRLIDELQREFTAKTIAAHHVTFGAIPWRRVYTTNYDNVFEKAASQVSKHFTPVTLSEDIAEIPKQQPLCVHLNGYVDRLSRKNLWSELKLTDTSYLATPVSDSAWGVLFRQDLSLARCVFFVGWSAGDLDIRRLLSGVDTLLERCFFVLGNNPDPVSERRASRYGHVLKIDVREFAELITSKQKVFEPPQEPELILHSWRDVDVVGTSDPLPDDAVFRLLLFGEVKSSHVYNSLHGGPRYVFERLAVDRILTNIKNGARSAVIHSGLGNGKTLSLEALKCRAVESGYEVFELVERNTETGRELDRLFARVQKPILIVLDNYPGALDLVRQFQLNAPARAAIVLGARSSAHDVLVDDLIAILGSDFPEYSVDRMNGVEVEWCREFFDEYGLWGDMAARSSERKRDFITNDCRGQWHAVLLRAFEAPQIVARLSDLMSGFAGEREYRDALIAVFILAVMNVSVSVDNLIDLLGPDVVTHVRFRTNKTVRELVDFRSGLVRLHSAAAAEFILKKVSNPNLTVPVLARLARRADAATLARRYYEELLTLLMRYSNLQHVFPEKGKREAIFRYYEAIKNLRSCRRNPLFWLQYGVAATLFESFERAAKYFANAYAYAKPTGFNTFQIDNHHARFLLLRAARQPQTTTFMEDFRAARRVVEQQIQDEKVHYPFRVAALYLDFFEGVQDRLTNDHKQEVLVAAESVAKAAR